MVNSYGKKLRFDQPANDFRNALPIGNGRIGAMVFGGVTKEKIILSEATLWSGSDGYTYPEDVYKVLPEITDLVMKGEYKKAQDKYINEFLAFRPMPMDGANCSLLPYGCMQTLGELNLSFFQFASGCNQEWYPYEMSRELNMEHGVVNFSHRSYWETNTPGYDKGMIYERKAFVSRKGECFVMKLSAGKEGSVSFNAQLSRSENYYIKPVGNDMLLMKGQLPDGLNGLGLKYACLLKIVTDGGTVETDYNVLKVRNANSAVIYITAATDMKCFGARNLDDEEKAVFDDMSKALAIGYDALLDDHIKVHSEMFNRCSLQVNEPDEEIESLTLDKRLMRIGEGKRDDGLIALMFNFGKYLLISSSRPDGMPIGILGVWCEEIQSPFNGDYHLNAQQIAYWNAECCNLPELHIPYLRLAEALQEPGRKVAKAFYDSRGWVAHTFTNPWLYALPGGEPHWGATITGGAWLCVHLWEHFLYSEDIDYLKWAYPIIKGSVEFLMDRLVTDPDTGKKVIFPGNTPENYFQDEQGNIVCIDKGTTYDMSITQYLFKAYVKAAKILDVDTEFVAEVEKEIPELAPIRVGSDGRIMEWQNEHIEPKPYHRHISPLWGAFPGDLISVDETPDLARGCVRFIEKRTFTGQTWAMIHRCGVLARLKEGDRINNIFKEILYYGITANLLCHVYFTKQDERTPETERLSPFDNRAIFEIDGNMGFTAVVVEMLMQSHRKKTVSFNGKEEELNVIDLLCALPSEWQSGRVQGIRARGDFIVDIDWADSTLKQVTIRSNKNGGKCVVEYAGNSAILDFTTSNSITLNGKLEEVK